MRFLLYYFTSFTLEMQTPDSNNSLEDTQCKSENPEKKEHRLLFIDDDKAILDGYKFIFESEGFIVDIAKDADNALKLAEKNHYAIIIIDYVLPGMKGDELAEKMHQIDDSAKLIVISGQMSAEEELQSRGIEVTEVFMKPLKIETLVDYIWERVSFTN